MSNMVHVWFKYSSRMVKYGSYMVKYEPRLTPNMVRGREETSDLKTVYCPSLTDVLVRSHSVTRDTEITLRDHLL